jgi:cellobiose phosphorylase
MRYGYFDDTRREYVITDPKTPVKWINYIGTLAFGGFVDQTGGALICAGDPSLNRITKYIPQLPAADFKGETLYLRLHEPQGYRVFSPFFVPTLDVYDCYECRVGLGYTRILSEFYGLRSEVTIFVPQGGDREIRDIRVTNLTDAPMVVDAIPVVEYSHPDALKQFTNADWVPQTMQSRAEVAPDGCTVLVQYPFLLRDYQVNYFTSNLPASSFETDRARFLGDHEYSPWSRPLSLLQPELSSWQARRGDNIAALLQPLGTLQPGETRRLITQLGQAETLAGASAEIARYRQPEAVDGALAELAAGWEAALAKLQAQTPDPAFNSMVNIFTPRQCEVTRTWARYLSLYQLGLGTRGMGFRDSSQDVLAGFLAAPSASKALIRQLLSVQKWDGSAMHQFNPLTMEGSIGDAMERDDRPHYYSDDHLWIVLAVCAYLKESGDWNFLDEILPFYEKDRNGDPLVKGAVMDHLTRALAFTQHDVGVHGLPKLGFADWNDTVNLARGAESLFTANLYGAALAAMAGLCRHRGNIAAAECYEIEYAAMSERVNQTAWDGAWYVRYFDADGTPLGSRTNREGQIYVNSQSWAVLSGFAPRERAEQALQAVHDRLNTASGIKLSTPGFNGFDPDRGGVTTYPPGAKENGGIFLHTNPWVIIAETQLGHGDRAYQYYCQVNPALRNERIEEFECEPYVYPQNILGDEHPQFGLGRNSWLSGTASWMYQAATQYILGLRPEYDGLRIDPCIPPAWDGFTVHREFRGAGYAITVGNPQHISCGVHALLIDGVTRPGSLAPVFSDGREHVIEVILGN